MTPRAQPHCWTCPAAPLWTRHPAEGQRSGLLPAGLGEEGEEPSAGCGPAACGKDGKGPHKAALELDWLSVGLPGTAGSPNPAGDGHVLPHGSAAGSTGVLVFPVGATSGRSPLFSGNETRLVFHVFFPGRKSVLIIRF